MTERPKVLLNSGWAFINIGDIGHTPGTLRFLEQYWHEAQVTLWLAHANEAAWRVADNGVQLLGGAGYVRDYPVEKWLRDTKALALFAPTSELADLVLAGAELDHHISGDPKGLPSSAIQPFFT